MQILLAIVAFLVIFSILILIHEFGHFFAAKRAGVKVEEFGMGLPPRIWGVKRGETLYSLNAIPFGGFVRMLGEEGGSAGNKRSFEHQNPGSQLWIVSAGVIMNLLLAFVLLTVGFWIGIDPLLTSQEDFYDAIRNEQVIVEPGLVVVNSREEYNTVVYLGQDLDIRSFEPGDRILEVEGRLIETHEDWEAVKASLPESTSMAIVDYADGRGGGEYLTTDLLNDLDFELTYVPRLIYREDPSSIFYEWLQDGDVIIRANGLEVLSEQDLYSSFARSSNVELEIYRLGEGDVTISDLVLPSHPPLVSYLLDDSPAEFAGVMEGDFILSIGGVAVENAAQVAELNQQTVSELGVVNYIVSRDGNSFSYDIELGEDGLVGVVVADRIDSYGQLSLYPTYVLHSLIQIVPERHGLDAPVVAVKEMWRLGKVTILMFADVFKNFIGFQEVPEGVAGPVGIAQMTFTVVQDGFSSLIRFVAMLSLSLGVINILPIPALDGGRAVFILYRGFTGRKPNAQIEHFIHMAGFFLLMLFIAYITFNDVLNLF